MMLGLYWHTVRHLKPIQIAGRLRHWLYHPKPDLRPAPDKRVAAKIWSAPRWRRAETVGVSTFAFLNERRDLSFPKDWNSPDIPKLWLYNLHYFNDLMASGTAQNEALQAQMIRNWIAGNPPAKGTGWEPYPISLRIANWIRWSLSGNPLDNAARHSLAVQTRYLNRRLEVHLLGNHLFENAKALVFAGLFFKGPEAEAWYRTGAGILMHQLPEQVLPDGGHFERTPMYHALILEGLLDILHLHQIFGITPPSLWQQTAAQMVQWLRVMTHPDGEICFFNDSTFGIAPRLNDIAPHIAAIGLPELPAASSGPILLKSSGFARLESRRAVLLADVGAVSPDYLPGHAHAATLSFELSLDEKRIVVNSGISCYGSGPERLRQRGTAAHSTLVIDDQNSSVVWSGFRVAQRARATVRRFEKSATSLLDASHDGYSRLPGRPIHNRSWRLDDNALEVVDQVKGTGSHSFALAFHFHPDIRLLLVDDRNAVARHSAGQDIRIELDPNLSWRVFSGTWHPGFGLSLPNLHLQGKAVARLPSRSVTRFFWDAS